MRLDLRRLATSDLDAAARTYAEQGYLLLDGLDAVLLPHFRARIAAALELDPAQLERLLDPHSDPVQLSPRLRRRMARIPPGDALSAVFVEHLEPLLLQLLGPFVQVNSTFHGQLKGGPAPVVDHGGYGAGYAEVQGQYLLHQDFSGASLPTSPSAVTLWAGLNDCDEWTLRLYPGSHRRGLLCNRWLELDDPRLASLGRPVDVRARAGQGVVFHALLLHGSSNPGRTRRVSCDVRFFPLCAFLPTPVRALTSAPVAAWRRALQRDADEILRAPLLEARAWLGGARVRTVASGGVLEWAELIERSTAGDREGARAALARMADTGFAGEMPQSYERFVGRQIHVDSLRSLRERLAALEPDASELDALDLRLRELEARG